MGTLARYGLTFIFLICAMTGYSQNMRVTSVTAGHAILSNKTAATAIAAPPAGMVSMFGSNNTIYSLSSAGVMTDLGAGGVASVPSGNTVWVDAINGNDGTGTRGSIMFPFLTLSAAKNVATAGDLIWARPGEYLGTNLLKNLVNLHFDGGAVVTNLGVLANTFESAMFHDYSGAVTSIVSGDGVFIMNYETNTYTTGFNQSAIVALSNGNSRVAFSADRINLRHFNITDTAGSAFHIVNCGLLIAKVNSIYDLDLDRHSFNPDDPESEIFSAGVGINWINGDCYFNVGQMYLENGRAIVGAGATNQLYYTGDSVRTYTDAFTHSATSPEQIMWIEVKNTFAQYAAINISGFGKFYFDQGLKVGAQGGGFGNAAVRITGNPETWITLQKLTSFGQPDPDFFDISGGVNFIRIQHYEQGFLGSGVSTLGPAVTITGGTNTFDGGDMTVTNVIGFHLSGANVTRLKNMVIRGFNSSGNGNSNECVLSTTNNTILNNTTLIPPNGVSSIKSTNGAINPIIVEGTVQASSDFGSGVRVSGGAFIVRTNMFVGLLTLPTAGSLSAPASGYISIFNSNNTIYALKPTGGPVDLESGSGGADDDGGTSTNAGALFTGSLFLDSTNLGLTTKTGAVAYVWSQIAASDIDWALNSSQYKMLTANTTFTFSNTNDNFDVVVMLQQDAAGTRTVTWPGNIYWVNSTNPANSVGINTNALQVSTYHFFRRNGTNFCEGPSTAPSMFMVDFEAGAAQTIPGAKTMSGTFTASSTIVHNGADQFKILTNAYSGMNVFLNLATNTMQFLLVTNNFTLIPTNQNVGQKISFTMYNTTATNITITHTAGIQIYGSGVSNVVVAAKHLKTAWESQDTAVTNVSAAFAQQKN